MSLSEKEALERDGFMNVDLMFEVLGIDGDAPAGTCKAALDFLFGTNLLSFPISSPGPDWEPRIDAPFPIEKRTGGKFRGVHRER